MYAHRKQSVARRRTSPKRFTPRACALVRAGELKAGTRTFHKLVVVVLQRGALLGHGAGFALEIHSTPAMRRGSRLALRGARG